MRKTTKLRISGSYFKVHVFDKKNLAWTDARKEGFESFDNAKTFVAENLKNTTHRIVEVSSLGRKVVFSSKK